jgi:hypothetical protein
VNCTFKLDLGKLPSQLFASSLYDCCVGKADAVKGEFHLGYRTFTVQRVPTSTRMGTAQRVSAVAGLVHLKDTLLYVSSPQPCWCTRTIDKGTRWAQSHVCDVRENGEPMRTKPTPTTYTHGDCGSPILEPSLQGSPQPCML